MPLKLSLDQTIYTWRTTCVSACMRVHIPSPHTCRLASTYCMHVQLSRSILASKEMKKTQTVEH